MQHDALDLLLGAVSILYGPTVAVIISSTLSFQYFACSFPSS
jgi:hypothetical protein